MLAPRRRAVPAGGAAPARGERFADTSHRFACLGDLPDGAGG
jgi:hypothetical protein